MISPELIKRLLESALKQSDIETSELLKAAADRIAEFIGESYNDLS